MAVARRLLTRQLPTINAILGSTDLVTCLSNVVAMEDFPPLDKTTVCVWRLVIPAIPRDRRGVPGVFSEINDPPPRLERLAAWLTPEERDRAARFYFDADRRRFAWTRGVLKTLLAYYAGTPVDRIHFAAAA